MKRFAWLEVGSFTLLALLGASVGPAQGADGAWIHFEAPVPAIAYAPSFGLATAFDSRRSRALCYGGHTSPPSCLHCGNAMATVTTLQAIDVAGGVRAVPYVGGPPTPLAYAAAAYDSVADQFWVVGGDTLASYGYPGNQRSPVAVVWRLDFSQSPPLWSRVMPAGPGPQARAGHSLVFDSVARRLVLFGGSDASGQALADTWALSVDGEPSWTPVALGLSAPSARYDHGAVYDQNRQRMLVLGGHHSKEDTASPSGLWALSLSGAEHWDSLAVAGPAPPSLLLGAAQDRARDRLVATNLQGVVRAIDLMADPLTWSALDLAADSLLSIVAPFSGRLVTDLVRDDGHDVIYAPAVKPSFSTFGYGNPPEHFAIAFPGAPLSTAAPHMTDLVWLRGKATLTWGMNLVTTWWSQPRLERSAPGSLLFDAGIAVSRDDTAGTMVFVDSGFPAGSDLTYRMKWRDWAASYASGDTLVHSPDAPATMPSSVDSAYAAGGVARLRWTFANDSLSWVEPPVVWRQSTLQGWMALGVSWPDEQRHVVFTDPTFVSGEIYTYEIRWNQGGLVRSTGSVGLSSGSPRPALTSYSQQFRAVHVTWRVPGIDPFTATLYRRMGPGPWIAVDTLSADPTRSLSMDEAGLPLGSYVDYRLGWMVGGAESFTAATSFAIPPFEVYVQSGRAGTDHVSLGWYVTLLDTMTHIQVQRRPEGDTAWVDVGAAFRDTVNTLAIEDSSLVPGTLYAYRVLGDDGVLVHASGDLTIETYAAPGHVSTQVAPGVVRLKWTHCRIATGYRVWRRVNAGSFQLRATPTVGTDSLVVLADNGIPTADSLTYRLEWLEEDLRWRAAPIVKITPQAGAGTTASLLGIETGTTWIRTRWWVAATDPGFVFQLLRRTGASTVWDTLATLDSSTGAEREYLDEAVGPDTTYHYRVEWRMGGTIGSTPEIGASTLKEGSAAGLSFASPAHGAAAITFSVPAAGSATLELYDIRGRLRWSRVEQGPAQLTRTVPAGTVEPGVYFLRLRSDAAVLTRRLVLLP